MNKKIKKMHIEKKKKKEHMHGRNVVHSYRFT